MTISNVKNIDISKKKFFSKHDYEKKFNLFFFFQKIRQKCEKRNAEQRNNLYQNVNI